MLAEICPPVTIVGDIHGQYADLLRLLIQKTDDDGKKKKYAFSSCRWVFLGDYVDRGRNSLECICVMFALKAIFSDQYVLLRGNHETRSINFIYGFRLELLRRLGETDGNDVWERFNEAFAWMPVAGLVGTRILCMHGGISPLLTSLDDIRRIRRPLFELVTCPLAQDLLWADPCPKDEVQKYPFIPNLTRGISVQFNEAAVEETAQKLDLRMFVRAHQVVFGGFNFFAGLKMCTVFSAPRYMDELDNFGAVMKISRQGETNVVIMKKSKLPGPRRGHSAEELTRSMPEPPYHHSNSSK